MIKVCLIILILLINNPENIHLGPVIYIHAPCIIEFHCDESSTIVYKDLYKLRVFLQSNFWIPNFMYCMTGPNEYLGSGYCCFFDHDRDHDIDLKDFQEYQNEYGIRRSTEIN